jgi:CRP-like cAMP-binding protein
MEVLRASQWQDYTASDEIVKEGEMDDRFYVIVSGTVSVERSGRSVGQLDAGECFGETSYVRGAKRLATIRGVTDVTLMKVSSTLLEQASAACQLRFNKVFLRGLISRLQNHERIA